MITAEEVLEIVKQESDTVELSEDTQLADLGFQSLDVLFLVQDVETKFNVVIPNERMSVMNTVGDVVKAVQSCSNSQ